MREKAANTTFWSDEMQATKREAIKRLFTEPEHSLLNIALEYDSIDLKTLQTFEVGLIEKWGFDWLLFPYMTGAQLYRRENGGKVICNLPGSKPNKSFFCIPEQPIQSQLIIAKSPREAMSLHQLLGEKANIIALCAGEVPSLSTEQEEYLRLNFSNIPSTYVFLDTDTPQAVETSMSLTVNIHKIMKNKSFVVDNHSISEGNYKDISDAFRNGESTDYLSQVMQNAKMPAVQNQIDVACVPSDENTSLLPKSIYDKLPKLLNRLCSLIDKDHKKDIFLLSALVVISAHLKNVILEHDDKWYTPDFYMLIIARAASGKGFANKAKGLGRSLDDYLSNFRNDHSFVNPNSTDNKGNFSDVNGPRGLYLPANSSDRALYDSLNENGGKGIIFESEIDTLLKANTQDWGNFTDLLRKAFHHEDLSISRKTDFFTVKNPALSMLLTGTHDQFRNLFRNTENGFYSRFSIYTFNSPPVWQSQRPTDKGRQLNKEIESSSSKLFDLYSLLSRREEKLAVLYTNKQWDLLDNKFEIIFNTQVNQDSDVLQSCLKRAGTTALRISTILTILRLFEKDPSAIERKEFISGNDDDLETALKIIQISIEHSSYLLFTELQSNDLKASEVKIQTILNNLPGRFTTAEALGVGFEVGYSERSIKRKLNDLIDKKKIIKVAHGVYEKVDDRSHLKMVS
ncbi:DUF3987 domain-containing protein [Rhodohalobacter sp. 8-1]|uniref:DUF3987 domain-containing protein n=1 Tax=Rhodohalobacter sp. 8-1 TaxID=3131972 RepID=UPI0030EE6C38